VAEWHEVGQLAEVWIESCRVKSLGCNHDGWANMLRVGFYIAKDEEFTVLPRGYTVGYKLVM
jgi:hypothetical protein